MPRTDRMRTNHTGPYVIGWWREDGDFDVVAALDLGASEITVAERMGHLNTVRSALEGIMGFDLIVAEYDYGLGVIGGRVGDIPRIEVAVVTGRDEDRKLGAGHQQLLFELREAMKRIAQCEDAPDIDPTGETQWGLHCGVEDRGCTGKYDGADYGYTQGVERAIEWAKGEAETALAKYDEAVK